MKMMNHQRDRFALFIDSAPVHQLNKGLARAGQAGLTISN
ncbi:hypothetical protein PMI28_05698 [Pseudomonas sp. GM48]|nr:hypothetical protein PMI28_05698 [Pseudomonas sp. GM48]